MRQRLSPTWPSRSTGMVPSTWRKPLPHTPWARHSSTHQPTTSLRAPKARPTRKLIQPTHRACTAPASSPANRQVCAIPARQTPPGIYHFGNTPHTSWHQFAQAIVEEALALDLLSKPIEVQTQPTSALNQPATRPPDGRLDTAKLQTQLGTTAPPWRADLRAVLNAWAQNPAEELDGH